ncbi:phospholipase d1 (macronuclear) [Tetrahymena thermophila SB210]|uniref:Phospholipase n=1 Tax=Tetrahymena thermophila (strain SB210) TaxID=312017 RepID=Q22T04_TETTS|nr:phospholipase d1 [Tetrahymena thermophila SB210]EAR88634.2 phospholipase d1 [Tetrahymena thermophila SB210]|eukprot:XP_001008879.2 phospholipase d1 [Tetrahymena thermophila SB210]
MMGDKQSQQVSIFLPEQNGQNLYHDQNQPQNKNIDKIRQQESTFSPNKKIATSVKQSNFKGVEQSNIVRTETGIKQNEILFTEHSGVPHQNIKSGVQDEQRERAVNVKCLKIQRMEYFIQQLQLQLLKEKLKQSFLNEAVFFLEVSVYSLKGLGEQTYRLRRIYQDFKTLEKNLIQENNTKKLNMNLPPFPFQKDPKNLFDKEIFLKIGEYLQVLCQNSKIVDTDTFWQFFEISSNFHQGVVKVKETFIKKRSGGRFKKQCRGCCHTWSVRYLAITSEGLMYSKSNRGLNSNIREILLFDQNFNMEYGKFQTGKEMGIVITTSTRKVRLECYSQFHFYDVLAACKEAISLSPYIEIHRFDSFAPERKDAECKWFVDGFDYFKDLYYDLKNAKSSVYITDWWLSPENYLLRPVGEVTNQESRLDRVLQSLGEKGVNIMIILYKEPTIALTLDSAHTKQHLKSLSNNIVIMRHPDYILPFLWSHHEKMVIIDQQIGYLGGLDLCYGRFDTQNHHLSDLPVPEQNEQMVFFPGIDYSNARQKDFENVKNHTVSNIDRQKQIRMPWHDVAMKVVGEPVKDMVRHFIQYWNFCKVDIYSKDKKNIAQIIPKKHKQQEEDQKNKKPQLSKMRNKLQGVISTFTKKMKNKLNLLDSNDKLNNQQMQNETMKGQPGQRRFMQYLAELKKIPSEKNLQNIENQDQEQQKLIQPEKNKDNISKHENTQQQQQQQQQQQLNYNSKDKRNSIRDSEIIIDKADVFEQKMQKIKKTQTNIAFMIEEMSEVDSEIQSSKIKVQQQQNAHLKVNAVPESISIEQMEGIEEFFEGENINPIIRYNNKMPNCSKLKIQEIKNELEPEELQVVQLQKKESKTLKKIFARKKNRADSNSEKVITIGINLIEKIDNLTDDDEEINFFQFNGNDQNIQVSEIIEQGQPISNNNAANNANNINPNSISLNNTGVVKKPSLWKTKVQEKLTSVKKSPQLQSQTTNLYEAEQIEKSKINLNFVRYDQSGSCKCQMLRSGSSWSLGLKPDHTELSIQIAYIQLIAQAQSFIYIENQFFISCTAGSVVKNQIAQALIDRILLADKKGEDFFVCVVMPLLPGFAGEVNDSNAAVMKCQLHWEYFTISRGGGSIYEVLKQHVKDPFKYIKFFGLRNHGVLNNTPYSEIIYVHSKLMIVDDKFVIIGSANINDRSMCGTRDSEIAMIVEDTKKVSCKLNGKYVMLNQFAHTFRMSLYQEHFGLTESEAEDPLNPQLLSLISERAKKNTEIYREVFRCYPDDQVTYLNQLEPWQKERKPENYNELKDQIKGHAVELPLDFLKNENLNFTIRQKEYFVPVQSFLQATWKAIQHSFTFFIC